MPSLKSNTVYTFEELMEMDLPDSPHLQFVHDNQVHVIQTSHVSDERLIKIPGMRKSQWWYEKTTRECVPIFWYEDEDIMSIVDINDIGGKCWVTPKGFPITFQ